MNRRWIAVVAVGVGLVMVGTVARAGGGGLDPSFGRGGRVVTFAADGALPDEITDIAWTQENKILAVGWGYRDSLNRTDFVIARYEANGSLDETFGAGGIVRTAFAGPQAMADSVTLLDNGDFVVAGWALQPDFREIDFALARYRPNGGLVSSFGVNGRVTTDLAGGNDLATAVREVNGKLMVVGQAQDSAGTYDIAVARYLLSGDIDTSFGSGGTATAGFDANAHGFDLAPVAGNGVVVVGRTSLGSGENDYALARFDSTGGLDEAFGGDGRVTTDIGGFDDAYAVVALGDGRIVVGGNAEMGGGRGYDFAVARYLSNGSLDQAFARRGVAITNFGGSDIAFDLIRSPEGKLIAAGWSDRLGSRDFALARYGDGGLDPTFGIGGRMLTDFAGLDDAVTTILLQPDGRIVAGGHASTPGGSISFALTRYL